MADRVPTMLDHLLLGCSDLDQGIAFVERHTGVRPAMGGVHPGRGTRNALLSLGPQCYFEVIAPDPQQSGVAWGGVLTFLNQLPALSAPQLIGWIVQTSSIEAVAERLRKNGVAFQGPIPGSRARPDGRVLHWQTLHLDDDRNGLLPFFIEWGAESVHPSVDAPAGCRLESFAVVSPDSGALSAEFRKLGIDVEVEQGNTAHLRARIIGPGGELRLGM
jgi:catechol 2,3-dioxygenase-like lactoylglutathione lyase family enzyme